MFRNLKIKELFTKQTGRAAGIIFIFVILALFISWMGTVASVKKQEVYTPKQYDAPKVTLQFQPTESNMKQKDVVFDQKSQVQDGSQQKPVVFTKIRSSEEEKSGKSYNFTLLSIILLAAGVILALTVYYHHASGKKSTFEIETVRR